MEYDLTNNKISYTYGRVVQVVSGSYYDGFGNLLPIGTSSVVISASTANFATTGSNTFIGNQIINGSVTVTNGITGSLYGTASWSITSSYSLTAESANNAQNILVYVKNTSSEIIPKGHVVRIVGVDNSGNVARVELADFTREITSANTLGLAYQELGINEFGYVITEGYLIGVDTGNFTSGDLLYLSSSGHYTNIVPVPPNHGVRLGEAVRIQQNNGSIYVRIDNGQELGESHDVIDNTTSASYGDLLVKNGRVWNSSRTLTGSYILSGSLTTNNSLTSSNQLINSHLILSQVSSSLDFPNDISASVGGVPLGGLYRNGNVIQIRLV